MYDTLVSLPGLAFVLSIISLFWQAYTWQRGERLKLEIYQQGTGATNKIERRGNFTYYQIGLVILNTSSRSTVVICGYDLELPWQDEFFDWLGNPEDPPPPEYQLSAKDPMFSYPADSVINHRLYERGTLTQTAPVVRGHLIGMGPVDIPASYSNGSFLEVPLFVRDQKGRRHKTKVKLNVSRQSSRSVERADGEQSLSPS